MYLFFVIIQWDRLQWQKLYPNAMRAMKGQILTPRVFVRNFKTPEIGYSIF